MKLTFECETCEGSGIHYEPQDHGTYEKLGCLDCQGRGTIEANASPIPWCKLHNAPDTCGKARPEQGVVCDLASLVLDDGGTVTACVWEDPQAVYRIGVADGS